MIISMILSVVMFVVTIPMKTVQLALKVKLKTDEKKSGNGSLRSKLGFRTRKEKKKKEKSKKKSAPRKTLNKAKTLATKAAIKALSGLMLFMKVLSVVVSIVGAILSLIISTCGLALLAGAGAFILLLNGSDIHLGVSIEQGDGIQSTGGVYMGQSDGTMATSVMIMGQYFIDYVADYNQSGYSEIAILNGQSIRQDCTGFAQAVIQYTLGDSVSVPAFGSANAMDENSTISRFLLEHGFERHDIVAEGITLDMLQPGDMLIDRHINSKGEQTGHAEFILGPEERFGWGDIQTVIPKKLNGFKRDDGTLGLYNNDDHMYKVLWRYVGQ